MSTKVCNKCKEVKLFSEFHKNKASKDGYQSKCKVCKKEHNAKYYAANSEKGIKYASEYRAANPEKIKDYQVEYRAANPEKIKESKDKHHAANPEKKKEYDAKWYAANPEKTKEYQVEYRAANPEKGRAWASNYRAVKLEAIPSWLTKEDYKAMEAIDKEADRLTRETGVKYEVDHIHPLQPPKVVMFDGEMIPLICAFHCPANLQILTKSQNCSKGNRFTPYVESEI